MKIERDEFGNATLVLSWYEFSSIETGIEMVNHLKEGYPNAGGYLENGDIKAKIEKEQTSITIYEDSENH